MENKIKGRWTTINILQETRDELAKLQKLLELESNQELNPDYCIRTLLKLAEQTIKDLTIRVANKIVQDSR